MHEMEGAHGRLVGCVRRAAAWIGTLKEFYEVVTWPQLGLHAKPRGILNILVYYSPLLRMFDHAVEEQFLKSENRALVLAQDGLLTCCKHLRNGVRRTLRNGSVGIRGQSARCSQRRAESSVLLWVWEKYAAAGRRGTEPAQFFGMPNERSRWP